MPASTHPAVVTVAPRTPLAIHHLPTPTPVGNEVRVRNEWTASTPLDLHQADGGFLVNHPLVLGDGVGGTVVEIGPDVQGLKVGDQVFGFTWREQKEKAYQLYVVAPENLLGKLPEGWGLREGVVLANNFVTAWHTLTKDCGVVLPWPKLEGYMPEEKEREKWVLVWGGASSVGQYVVQILKWYGYDRIITTASQPHHEKLKRYGAKACFDYREGDVVQKIREYVGEQGVGIVVDCIGALDGSVRPISNIARNEGAKVAVMLPVIVRDTAEGKDVAPEYTMDVASCADWAEGVDVSGVRTHFYMDNKFLGEKLQSEIMPEALKRGIVEPNDYVVVEGASLLERAEKALAILRRRGVSGKRLVWRVADEGQQ